MTYVWAFLIGGLICGLTQLAVLYAPPTLQPAHFLVGLTVIGAILGGLGLYQPLVDFAGGGALVPVSGFGNAMVQGMLSEAKRLGWEGLLSGAFEITGLGIAAAIVSGFIVALTTRPKH